MSVSNDVVRVRLDAATRETVARAAKRDGVPLGRYIREAAIIRAAGHDTQDLRAHVAELDHALGQLRAHVAQLERNHGEADR